MSDSEGDFSDELLELAGATEKKRRKRQSQSKPMKRRRASADHTESEGDDNDSGHEAENPYPLDGKYTDEEDRERLLSLPEVEREEILAQRQEELQRIQDKRNLDQMLRERAGAEDSVSKAAKRQHAQRGATKEKSRKLDELKAKRRAKGEKKRTKTDSPGRARSSSPMDMEMSDDEEEDGQITRYDEEEEERERSTTKSKLDSEPITLQDLQKAQLTRDTLARHWRTPNFEELITGGFVRYSLGEHKGEIVYRICDVIKLLPKIVKEYKLNNRTADQQILIRHGEEEKGWGMDMVSNSPFTEKEFQRYKNVTLIAKRPLPTRSEVEKKAAYIERLNSQPLTEADIKAMLKGRETASRLSSASIALEKSRVTTELALARGRKDYAEAEILERQLAAITGRALAKPVHRPTPTPEVSSPKPRVDIQRKADNNPRKQLASTISRSNGTATPPLSRVKALLARESRQGTPLSPEKAGDGTPGSLSPAATPTDAKAGFEASVLDSVEIDLGDF